VRRARAGRAAWAAARAAAAVAAVAAGVVDRVHPSGRLQMNIQKQLIRVAIALAMSYPIVSLAQAAASPPAAKSTVKQKTFASAEEASKALIDAVNAKSVDGLLAVVGPGSSSWLFSGDMVQDANDWKRFLASYNEKHALQEKDGRAILEVGNDGWPFPAPIVKKGSTWAFDANEGRAEILYRRIGRNELDAMQTLLAIVDAQREYAATDADKNGFADYAKKFRSSPGKKDGLFWPTQGSEPASPLGPLVAVAAREGYGKSESKSGERVPYHGYYYKILTKQGKDAQGGASDYMVGDKLLGGFALVAWPASYRASGVTTFIVNYEGTVYEKDLGANTASTASSMTVFNPDKTWRKSQ